MLASVFGLITFIVGGFVGFAVYHYFFRLSNQERQLLEALEKSKHSFKEYQHKVASNLKETANLVDQLQQNSNKLQDHILQGSVNLNLDQNKQSILQPMLHADPLHHDDHDDEQVTEFHPQHTAVKTQMVPPRDYV